MGWFTRWRARRQRREEAARLYGEVVAWARTPELYAELGVPDTREGRFEMLCLHLVAAALGLRRAGLEPLAQELIDLFFLDLDRHLREAGVGDLSVGKQVKRLGEVFLARSRELSRALEKDDRPAATALLQRILPQLEAGCAEAIAARLFDLTARYAAGVGAVRNATTGAS